MFFDLKKLQEKYNLNLDYILHIGAHNAEEKIIYADCNAKKIHWVEANKKLCENLNKTLDPINNFVSCAVISEEDDLEIEFNIANNSQASSILDLGKHKELFPNINYIYKEKRKTSTIKSLIEKKSFLPKINFLNIDIQGAELKALKGAGDLLYGINSIYIEINTEEVYKECALLEEITEFLLKYGFKLKEIKFYSNHPWGDAFYINEIINK